MSTAALPISEAVDQGLSALEQILQAQLAVLERLDEALTRRRHALTTADAQALAQAAREEHGLLSQLTSLEQKRLATVGVLTELAGAPHAGPLKLSEIADVWPGDRTAELRDLGAAVRERLAAVRRESGVLRQAAERLQCHLNGIMQTVTAAMNQATTYSRRGKIAAAAGLPRTLDIQT